MTILFSQACENNKHPILTHLYDVFPAGSTVLEIGSRTAQHVMFFAEMMPNVRWQPTDIAENMSILMEALREDSHANVAPPVMLDVTMRPWPFTANAPDTFSGVFSANTLHIMPVSAVEVFSQARVKYSRHVVVSASMAHSNTMVSSPRRATPRSTHHSKTNIHKAGSVTSNG